MRASPQALQLEALKVLRDQREDDLEKAAVCFAVILSLSGDDRTLADATFVLRRAAFEYAEAREAWRTRSLEHSSNVLASVSKSLAGRLGP